MHDRLAVGICHCAAADYRGDYLGWGEQCVLGPQHLQSAGIAALSLRHEVQPAIIEEFRRRTLVACEEIGKIDYLSVLPPQGSIYLFVNIKRTGLTSHEFASQLLDRYHILVIPGNVFGSSGEGYVRLALTLGEDKIRQAFARLPKDKF